MTTPDSDIITTQVFHNSEVLDHCRKKKKKEVKENHTRTIECIIPTTTNHKRLSSPSPRERILVFALPSPEYLVMQYPRP